jgi:glycerate 2-kinase
MTELIKNKNQLASSKIRRQALDILECGIAGVLPDRLISSSISFERDKKVLRVFDREHPLPGRIFVIGAGKASGLMAQTIERLIGPELITAGIVVEKADPADFETGRIQILQAGHPIPDSRGEKAAESIFLLKSQFSIGGSDTILCLISGGGSALLPSPAEGITLEDKQMTSRLLIASGADIREINSVRKHLSRVKGGRLAGFFHRPM